MNNFFNEMNDKFINQSEFFDHSFESYLEEVEQYAAELELTVDYVLDEFCILGELVKL